MLGKIRFNPFGRLAGRFEGVQWFRVAIEVQVVILLIIAVMLTIMPVTVFSGLATATAWLRDLAISARPLFALAGLAMVLLCLAALQALIRRHRKASSTISVERIDQMADVSPEVLQRRSA